MHRRRKLPQAWGCVHKHRRSHPKRKPTLIAVVRKQRRMHGRRVMQVTRAFSRVRAKKAHRLHLRNRRQLIAL